MFEKSDDKIFFKKKLIDYAKLRKILIFVQGFWIYIWS